MTASEIEVDSMNPLKTRLCAIISFCLLSLVASAQEKLWTWKAESNGYSQRLHAVSMKADGSAAFVIGQATIGDAPDSKPSTYLLVWVDRTGKVLLSSRLPTTDSDWFLVSGRGGWEVAFYGEHKLVVANNDKVRIYTLEDGKISAPRILKQTHAMLFGGDGFKGWLERESILTLVPVRDEYSGSSFTQFERIISLTAWRF